MLGLNAIELMLGLLTVTVGLGYLARRIGVSCPILLVLRRVERDLDLESLRSGA